MLKLQGTIVCGRWQVHIVRLKSDGTEVGGGGNTDGQDLERRQRPRLDWRTIDVDVGGTSFRTTEMTLRQVFSAFWILRRRLLLFYLSSFRRWAVLFYFSTFWIGALLFYFSTFLMWGVLFFFSTFLLFYFSTFLRGEPFQYSGIDGDKFCFGV